MYAIMKTLHVLAVVLFLGNIVAGLFWKAHADRTGDPRIIAHAMEGIIRSDRLFTIPGVVMITAFGVTGAIIGGLPILGTAWIAHSLLLFSLSGLVFMVQVVPLQRTLLAVARAADKGTWDRAAYHRLSRRWEFWGLVALLAPVAALVLMVVKPGS